MEILFPYGEDNISVDVDDQNLLGVFSPGDIEAPVEGKREIRRSIEAPIGCKRLENTIGSRKSIAIAVDDNTRITPVREILEVLFKKFMKLGVKSKDVLVIVALGTHRKMTDEELLKKFGPEILENYRVISHEWDDPAELRFMGELPTGDPILINKHFIEGDVRIGIGNIIPHFTSGWSGGSKILLPGLAGAETVAKMHYYGAKRIPNALGKTENICRELMDSLARRVGVHMIINTVLTRSGEIAGVFSGDVKKAYRRGVELCKKVYGIPIPRKSDITVVSSYPADLEFWQSMKGLYSADLSTRKEGGILLITPSPEGLSTIHKEWGKMLSRSSEELRQMIEEGEIEDVTAASLALCVIKTRETPYEVALYSHGISEKQADQLHFNKVGSPGKGLEYLKNTIGKEAKVLALTHGGESLPLVEHP